MTLYLKEMYIKPGYIMTGHAFVVAKEVFHHRSAYILTLWEWLNDDKRLFLFKFSYIKKHLYLQTNFVSIFIENVVWKMAAILSRP